MRTAIAGAAIALTLLGAVAFQLGVVAKTGFQAGDFRAFYCAARVAAQGSDPYRAQPLHTCETAHGPAVLFQKNPNATVPAPLPGYDIAVFLPFARIPFATSAGIWLALLTLATIAGAAFLARPAGITWPVPLAAFGLSVGVASIPFGEVVPIAVAAICACAYFAWRDRWWGAALSAAAAMIEPHLGLPVCVALAIWAPKARLPIAVSLAALGFASIVTLGLPTNVEYFLRVLPAHALSEAARDTQFSLTAVMTSLGAKDAIGARLGFGEYLAMLAIGTYVAGVLANKFQNRAFLACVPPAFAVFGGTFIHVTQIAAALPAALLLLAHVKAERRAVATIALLLLSVPWILAWSPVLGLAPAFPVAFLAWHYWRDVRAVVLAAIVSVFLLVGLNRAYVADTHAPAYAYSASAIDRGLAEASWREFARTTSTGSVAAWAVRLPTWAALAGLLSMLIVGGASLRARAPSAATLAAKAAR